MDLARILASRPLAPKLDPHATLGEDGPRTTRFRPKTRPGTTRRRHSLSPFINYCLRGFFRKKNITETALRLGHSAVNSPSALPKAKLTLYMVRL